MLAIIEGYMICLQLQAKGLFYTDSAFPGFQFVTLVPPLILRDAIAVGSCRVDGKGTCHLFIKG
jgi:hypothetical protein